MMASKRDKLSRIILSCMGICMYAAAAGQAPQSTVTFTYAGDDPRKMNSYGSALEERHDAGICIDEPLLAEYKIKKITGYLRNNTYTLEHAVWVSSGLYLEDNVNRPDIFESDEIELKSGVFNGTSCDIIEYVFDDPIPVGEAPVYVGYSFTSTRALSYNAIWIYENPDKNGFFYHGSESMPYWADNSSMGWSLIIEVELEGSNSLKAVNISGMDDCYATLDTPFEATAYLVNPLGEAVREIEYSYTIDDGEVVDGMMKFDSPIEPDPAFKVPVKLRFEGVRSIGRHKVSVRVDKVDGVENASANPCCDFEAVGVPFIPKRRPLVEEYTGLWCGWCPQGYVAMQEINKCFREDVVVMSYHYNDNLSVTSNYPMVVSGYPKLSIDRIALLNPYNGTHGNSQGCGVVIDIAERMENVPVADVEVKNVMLSSTDLSFDINVTFVVDLPKVNCELGYAVTANGLTTSQLQSNYYSGMAGYEGSPLEPFTQYGSYVRGLVFDDVVVNVGDYKGARESIPASVKAGEVISHGYTVPLNGVKYCSDPDMLVINAFIIDKTTSQIVNANKAYASAKGIPRYDDDEEEDDITLHVGNAEEAEPVSVEYFDMTGRRIHRPSHGVYVARYIMPDGSVSSKKIMHGGNEERD